MIRNTLNRIRTALIAAAIFLAYAIIETYLDDQVQPWE